MNKLSDKTTVDINGPLTKILIYLYEQFSVNPLPSVLEGIPLEFESYVNFVYSMNNQEPPEIINPKKLESLYHVVDRNKTVLAFSGGKDSVASAYWLKDNKIPVQLYYVKGINASYPNEEIAATTIANKLDMPLDIQTIRFKGTKDFHENPVKNHLILASMVDKYYPLGYANYSFGTSIRFASDEYTIDYDLSDCPEFFTMFKNIIRMIYPHFTLRLWWEDEGESQSYLCIKHPSIIEDIQSCMMGLRYRDSLKRRNEEKYNVKLLPNRCGSCYKCAAEYMLLAYYQVIQPNKGFIKHCMDIFKQTWNVENPDKLDASHYTNEEILNESIFKNRLKMYRDRYKD